MGFHLDTSELRDLAHDLKAGAGTVDPKTELAVAKVGLMVEADAKGNAPVDTGTLRSSISAEISGLSAEVSATTEYADYVEYGTSRMRPQPYMGPALDKNAPILEQALGKIGEGIL
jgi:HK97 gp10 family phage protein